MITFLNARYNNELNANRLLQKAKGSSTRDDVHPKPVQLKMHPPSLTHALSVCVFRANDRHLQKQIVLRWDKTLINEWPILILVHSFYKHIQAVMYSSYLVKILPFTFCELFCNYLAYCPVYHPATSCFPKGCLRFQFLHRLRCVDWFCMSPNFSVSLLLRSFTTKWTFLTLYWPGLHFDVWHHQADQTD